MIRKFLLGSVAALLLASPALADSAELLGAFTNWTAYSTGTGSNKTCYAMSAPRAQQPRNLKRGAIFLMVSDWPARKVKAEPEIAPGYAYKPNAVVTLGIGGDRFNFFSRNDGQNGSAWLQNLNDAGPLLDALNHGVSAVAIGTSARGTKTVDTYSLAGFGDALAKDSRRLQHVMAPAKTSLIGLDPGAMAAALIAAGLPEKSVAMRVRQLWNWIYVHGARDFAAMSNLAKDFRTEVAAHFTLARPEIVTEQISTDGTRKWLLRTGPGIEFESVYIPESQRGTLCVSSQVGCTLTCRFCHTGTQKLVRNLTPAEIVGQLLVARDALGDWPSTAPGRKVTNVVMMGMGEPLYNFDNVKAALAIVTDGDGLALSKRRVTLSTAGVVPMIERAGAEIGSGLAISLHAVRDELRDEIVPINKKYPIKTLLDACRAYPGASNSRRITFEYVMLKGVNDSLADARALVKLLAGIPAKINLIPFNPWPGAPYECSDWSQIEKFAQIVNKAGYASPVRTPRGRDIMAACGQLKSESVKGRASTRLVAEKMADMQSGQLARMPQ